MAAPSAQAFVLEAHAKVNLCLDIGYPPHDGYHVARSVFQQVDLHDIMRVRVADAGATTRLVTRAGTPVSLTCPVDGLEPEDNLVFRALNSAEQVCGMPAVAQGCQLVIDIEKHIPAGGGLGGGSSDAAAMLKAYAHLTGLDERDERLEGCAKTLGADVAFFLHGGAALMVGRGDTFAQALPQLQAPIVLMGGDAGLSTPVVYRTFDEIYQGDCPRGKSCDPGCGLAPNPDALACAMQETPADIETIAALCANNLGPAACALDAGLAHRLEAARRYPGVLVALVSGSGSTSFAICADEKAAHAFAQAIEPLCSWVHVCRIPPIFA